MPITMKYGKKGFVFDPPADCVVTVIQKPVMPVLADPDETLRSSWGARPAAVPCGKRLGDVRVPVS